jgi:hypothetical protein
MKKLNHYTTCVSISLSHNYLDRSIPMELTKPQHLAILNLSNNTFVDDYSFVRHPPGHRVSESTCERAHELGVPMRWVCYSSLRLRWNAVCLCVG